MAQADRKEPAPAGQPGLELSKHDLNRNFCWGVTDGSFYNLFTVLMDVNLIFPWLLSQLTDSLLFVSLAPTIAIAGSALPQMFVARWVQRNPFRKYYVAGFILMRAVTILPMLPFLFWEIADPQVTLAVIMICYTLSNIANGFSGMTWTELTAKAMPPNRLSSLFGMRSFIGGILGLGLALFIRSFLGATVTVPLPRFGTLFLMSIVCLIVMAVANLFIREPAGKVIVNPPPFVAQLREAAVRTWQYRPYRHYLFLRVLFVVSLVAAPLYIVEGRRHYGLLAESLGTYTMAGLLATIFASLAWSAIGDLKGLISLARVVAVVSLAPPLLALAMPAIASTALGSSGGWMMVFMALGIATSGLWNVSMRGSVEMPHADHRVLMIGVGNTFAGVVTLAGPLIGILADVGGSGAAFVLVAVSALAMLIVIPGMEVAPMRVRASEALRDPGA